MSKSQIYLNLNLIKLQKQIRHNSTLFALISALPIAVNLVTFFVNPQKTQAQSVIPARDGTGTVVTPNGNQFDITGGQFSQDGSNLFHSFKQFGLSENQIANFLSNPAIKNILGRVTGGNPSIINGLIQVNGGNSNLFLMNPSGIVFGNNASLNLPADFIATTANGIGFEDKWFNALGKNNYASLIGTPNSFAFSINQSGANQSGAIVNFGNLGVTQGHNLTFLGGTVASTGKLEVPGGSITVSAVPGESLVRLSQPGNLLSLEVKPLSNAKTQPQSWNLSIASLPEMLTGGNTGRVTELVRNSKGEVELKGANLQLNQGDVTVKNLNAQNALLSAEGNLTLVESQLQTTKNLTLLAKDTVRVRDSAVNPFIALAGGNFSIQGDRGIDILALNHLDRTPFVSGGDLSLVSDGIISGDAHFASGGKFSILNLQGNPGKFVSLYDPIISSEQDVTFGSYTGAALKVESKGSITVNGDIEITSRDNIICESICSADAQILANETALILRAGVSSLEEPAFNYSSEFGNPPATFNGTSFNASGTNTLPANVTVNGDINTNFEVSNGRAGRVIVSAPGNITTGNIFTFADFSTAESFDNAFTGEVNLNAGGNIFTQNIDSHINLFSVNNVVSAGKINLNAGGNIFTGEIDSSAILANNSSQISAGEVSLKSGGNIIIEGGIESSVSVGRANEISAGKIDIDSGGNIFADEIDSSVNVNGLSSPNPFSTFSNNAFGGEINLKAVGDILTGPITSSIDLFTISDNGLAGNINLAADGNITVQDIAAFIRSNTISPNNVAAGSVNITSGENIIFGSVNTANTNNVGEISIPIGKGGDVKIIADNGTVRGGVYLSVESPDEVESFQELEVPEWLEIPEELDLDEDEVVRLFEISGGDTIYTAGEESSGSVEISHDGTIENIPFIVGDASVNGTAGAINTGDNIISPTTEFPNPGTITQGNISINFNNTSADIIVNSSLNIVEENQPIIFTLADLNLQVNDVNNDIVSLQINEIAAGGTLKINGTEANSGDIITPVDILEYTPPTNATGRINAFTIVANDKISISTPAEISVNASQIEQVPETETEPELPKPPEPKPPKPKPPFLFKPNETPNRNNQLQIDTMVGEVEDSFSNTFKDYLGHEDEINLKGLSEAREILSNVEKASGIKPALVYAMFVPQHLPSQVENNSQDSSLQDSNPQDSNLQDSANKDSKTNLNKDNYVLDIVIVTPKGKPIRRQIRDVKRINMLKVARKFQREVSNPRKTGTTTYLKPAKQLYQWLIAPIESELQAKGIQNLTFITDVGLRSIPFAALHDGKNFLVERYSIGLMPSLSLTNTNYADIKKSTVLAMGASKFKEQNALPAVPLEINTISKQWKSKAFLDENFTLENLKSQRYDQPFGIIHLATHAEFRPGKLQNSYIQLSNTKLRLDKVRELGWNDPPVELLTLSACRTALGNKDAELGFAGLAVQAGVKSALGSLWYVSDEGTLGLMAQFYQQLKNTPIKAEALRKTQIAILKGEMLLDKGVLQLPLSKNTIPIPSLAGRSKKLVHPYYWSSFTLVGSPW